MLYSVCQASLGDPFDARRIARDAADNSQLHAFAGVHAQIIPGEPERNQSAQ